MMRKIRVLQVVPNFVIGGAERFVVQLMRALDPEHFDVSAISLYGRQGTELESMLADYSLPVTYLGKTRGFNYRMFRQIIRVIRSTQADVIHTHLQAFNYVAPALLALKNTAAVHTIHSVAERERRRIGRLVPRFLFGRNVVPVAIAAEVQAGIRRVYGIESVFIPNGIPTDVYRNPVVPRAEWRKRAGFSEEDVLFVSVGRFDAVKNHDLLISAFAQAFRNIDKTHLLLVGDGRLRQDLQTKASELGFGNKIHFLGGRTDIPEVLGACDVYAFASNHEGSPLSVMEAMAAGLPIAGTAVGGVPEMAPNGDAGMLTPAKDAPLLAASLEKLHANRRLRTEMGRRAAQLAAQFDIAATARSYEALYTDIVKAKDHSLSGRTAATRTSQLPERSI